MRVLVQHRLAGAGCSAAAMRLRLAIVTAGVLLPACATRLKASNRDGATSPSEAASPNAGVEAGTHAICDGSPSLRLRLYHYSNPTANLRGSAVRIENGIPSFGLDGQCTYYINGGWVNGALDADLGWRYGTLPQEVLDALDAGLDLSHLEGLQDCGSSEALFDVAPWILASAQSKAACVSPGPRLSKAVALIESRALALWAGGQQMGGGIRLSAVSASDPSPIYPWPLAAPLSDFMTGSNDASNEYGEFAVGVSHLVSGGADARLLRGLREQYLVDRTAAPGRFTDGQLMSDGKTKAFVYMRDALPYEDDRGLWPFR